MANSNSEWLAQALAIDAAKANGLAAARLADGAMLGKGGFTLKSVAFEEGGELDPCFTADEEDAVAPPLEWSAPPAGALEMALLVECPDAPGDQPFCHWLVWGLAAQKGQLLEGEAPPRVGKNSFGNSEWLLPDPPTGADPHDYIFQLFALDLPLTLMPGASREELLAAIEGHVVGLTLMKAIYAREEGGEYDWEGDDEGIDI